MRLIDADALLERMKRTNRYFNVKFDIEEAPTIEAEPVRHGQWERTSDGAARCTACKRKMNSSQYGYAFCGLCGAKMDLKGLTNDKG